MKKRNGWLYAFWILIIVVLVLAIAVGLISWAGSGTEESEGGAVEENPYGGDDDGGSGDEDDEPSESTILSVSLSRSSLAFEYGSETGSSDLTATVTMDDGSDYEGDYTWESSNESVATVEPDTADNSKATVTAGKCGEAAITVSVGEGDNVETASCTVTVSEDHTAAEAARVTGSAETAEGFNFTFDDDATAEGAVLFNDSAVHASYDADTKTYTLSGASAKMTSDQANAFWGSTDGSNHVGHEYIGFIVNVNAGETVKVESYTGAEEGAAADKTFTFTSPEEDTSFLVDIEDHANDGDWYDILTVIYAGGDEETYKVVLGDVEPGVSNATDLQAAIAQGGEVALTEDIELSSSLTIGTSGGTGDPVEVTLDLNECSISSTNTSSQKQNSTIVVEANAELTVIDSGEGSGTVDATANDTAALFNNGGKVTIAGGTFERTQENGLKETKESNQNSYYTVLNYCGDMTIEDGAVIFNSGDYSTCLKSSSEDPDDPATLTINGGKIYGGKFAVKNDYSGILTITGGEIGGLRSETDSLPYRALDNYDQAIITGGILRGGNGGAVEVSDSVDGAVAEGLVIYNNTTEQSATDKQHNVSRGDEIGSLTIGDENGNGPEIIYEGINPNASVADDYSISYYDEDSTPAFATGIAIESGTVNVKAGTIERSDATEIGDYSFMGVYLTNGALNVSGGNISGDVAIAIDCTGVETSEIEFSITGGQLVGDIIVYSTDDEGNVVASVYTPGSVIVPSEEFTFNEGTFDGLSGLTEDFAGEDETEYKAGDITITWTVDATTGELTAVVDGVVANQMSDEQKIAFDASYASDEEGTVRFYIAVQIAIQPGETVTVVAGGKTETVPNETDAVIYTTWVIEIGQSHFVGVTSEFGYSYVVVDLSSFSMTVSIATGEGSSSSYTISFGNVFLPAQAWKCARGEHTVSVWNVDEEETCGTAGSQTGVCDYCGETVTKIIPATGLHTATEYDGTKYAVYCEDEAWYALCEVCDQWFEIDSNDIYSFVLVATDEDSLNAALEVAEDRADGSDTNRTQILVYGTITISDNKYVSIDCDNVEIYGLGAENSKIIDSAYDGNPEGTGVATSGVEISGKNVTIRDLTIDGTALNELDDNHTYKHAVEIKGGAENVTISGCVITGGGTDLESDSSICIMEATGTVLIENCTLSGAYNGLVIEHGGQDIEVTVSYGKIDAIRPIWIDGGHGVTLLVENAEIFGRNSFGDEATSIKFTNCTLGFHISDSGYIAYGAVSTHGDVTLENCTFLSHDTGTNLEDFPVKNSNNYAIQVREDGVTITIIDCKFENTHTDLTIDTLDVTNDNLIYIIAYLSYGFNVVIGESENALEYIYDSSTHTVEHNHIWIAGETDATTGKTTYTCEGCGATKTEVTGNHVVSATPDKGYVVTTVEGSVTIPEFAIVMSEGSTTYASISDYLAQSGIKDTVTWSSDNTSVATVDESGKVTLTGATGVAAITVKFEITELEASYTIYVGEPITEDDPLFGEWSGKDTVTIEELSMSLTVDVVATVDENGFTLEASGSALGGLVNVDVIVWENVAWFKADGEYYIVVEEADGSYELIDISYDAEKDQLSTSFEFTFEYTVPLIGTTMDVTVDVENATLDRVEQNSGTEPND